MKLGCVPSEIRTLKRTLRLAGLPVLAMAVMIGGCYPDGPQIDRLVASPIVLPFPPGDENK